MKKFHCHLVLFILLLLTTSITSAQYYPKLDSLISLAQRNKADSLVILSFEQAQTKALEEYGKKDSIYWHYLYKQAQWHYDKKQYQQALSSYTALLTNIDSTQNRYWYARGLYHKGRTLYRLGKTSMALGSWKQTYRHLNLAGVCPQDTLCLKVSMDLAIKLSIVYLYQEAIHWNNLGLEIAKTTYGDTSKYYAIVAKFLGKTLNETGTYHLAEIHLNKALAIYKKLYGEQHGEYINTLATLASTIQRKGNTLKAKSLFQQIEQTIEENNSSKSLWEILAFIEVIDFYSHIQDQKLEAKARETLQQYIGESYGVDSDTYSSFLGDYATMFFHQGDYLKAEEIYRKSLKIKEKLGLTQQSEYAKTLDGLGRVYWTTGRYQQSIETFKQSLAIIDQTLGKDNPQYSNTLAQLVRTYNDLDSLDISQKLITEALVSFKDTTSLHYGFCIEVLADVFAKKGNLKAAKENYKKLYDIFSFHLGKDHYDVYTIQILYAETLSKLGEYHLADSIFKQSKKALASTLGKHHRTYQECSYGQAMSYNRQKNIPLATTYYKNYLSALWERLSIYQTTLAEQEQLDFLASIEDRYQVFSSFVFDHFQEYPSLVQFLAQKNLQIKATSLDYKKTLKRFWAANQQDSLYRVYQDWINLNYAIANLYAEDNNPKKIDSLSKELYTKEKILSLGSTPYTKNWKKVDRLAQIHQKLDGQSVAIDFIYFQYYDVHIPTDTSYYGALVYTSDSTNLQLIPLCTEQALAKLLDKKITNDGHNLTTSTILQQELYKLVWQPLEKVLKSKKNVHIVPSGLLQNLPFELLKKDAKSFLLNEYNIHYYNNLRDFILEKTAITKGINNAVLIGDIEFDIDSLSLVQKSKKASIFYRSLPQNDSLRNNYFTHLAATQKEIKNIQKLLAQQNWEVITKVKKEANEEFIKTELTTLAPTVVHIATHGFYLPSHTQQDKKFYHLLQNTPNVLMQSGIALAGANYAWQGNSPIKGVEDGIFTAYEATQLDLHQTDLVVLSACKTGRGDSHKTEGIMGLQRAFKQAGANNLIISLWDVSDQITAELMRYFYQAYAKQPIAYKALKKAKNKIRKKYKSPFYWAAFILIE